MSDVLNAENCREYLKAVIDPEIYQNIVDLGLVYGVDVRADEAGSEPTVVDVTMTYTTPMCPLGPQIIADVEQVLMAKGASLVNVNVVFEPMWTPDMMTDDLKRELGMLEDEEPQLEIDPPAARPADSAQEKGLLRTPLRRLVSHDEPTPRLRSATLEHSRSAPSSHGDASDRVTGLAAALPLLGRKSAIFADDAARSDQHVSGGVLHNAGRGPSSSDGS